MQSQSSLAGRMARSFGLAVALAAGWLAAAQPALAQDAWPSRRITLVVPFAAGSVTDAVARIVADQYQTALGQPFVVENRAGAGGMLGAGTVAKADPDGYTFLMGGNTTHSAVRSLFKNVAYDPLADFTPIARVGRFGSVLATNPTQPFKTIQQFVAYAKANQGKLSCGHGNSTGHITCETVKARLGLANMARVAYKSNPSALQDLLSNNIQLMVPDFLTGIPQIKAGKIIPLAAVMRERTALLPDVPTFHETVIKDFEVAPWTGLFAPAKLPQPITKRMSDLAKQILGNKEVASKITGTGTELYLMESAAFAKFVKDDVPVWAAHAKTAGITPQ